METLDCIKSRRSIRKFLERKVEDKKLFAILEAGNCAPSSGNVQNWRFIVVEDEETRHEIAKAADQSWVGDAPVIVVVCSLTRVVAKEFDERGEKLYAEQNVAAAVENMLLVANDLGLGGCWVGAFDDFPIKQTCHIPDSAEVHAVIPIGYPAKESKEPKKLAFADVCFWRFWDNRKRKAEYPKGEETIFPIGNTLDKVTKRAQKSVNEILKKMKKK